jgi:hypothetical protein
VVVEEYGRRRSSGTAKHDPGHHFADRDDLITEVPAAVLSA